MDIISKIDLFLENLDEGSEQFHTLMKNKSMVTANHQEKSGDMRKTIAAQRGAIKHKTELRKKDDKPGLINLFKKSRDVAQGEEMMKQTGKILRDLRGQKQ